MSDTPLTSQILLRDFNKWSMLVNNDFSRGLYFGDTGQRFLGHVYKYCDNLPEDLSEMTAVLNRLYSLACFLNLKRKNNEEKKWAFCCKKTDNTPFFLHCKWRFLFSVGRLWTFAGLKAFYQRKWSLSLCCAVSLSEKENQKMPFVHMKTEQIGT